MTDISMTTASNDREISSRTALADSPENGARVKHNAMYSYTQSDRPSLVFV